MSSSQTVTRDEAHRRQARRVLWPVAITTFLFTVSYPANDYVTASKPSDIGLGMFLVFAAIALVTMVVVFGVVLPWALPRDGSGGLALTLAIVGFLLAPGFWTGFPPGLAAGGALLGWAGTEASHGRMLSYAALVIGLLGVVFNVVSYVAVFV
jgi:hypothetical protein